MDVIKRTHRIITLIYIAALPVSILLYFAFSLLLKSQLPVWTVFFLILAAPLASSCLRCILWTQKDSFLNAEEQKMPSVRIFFIALWGEIIISLIGYGIVLSSP